MNNNKFSIMAHGVGEILSENNNSTQLVHNNTCNQSTNNQMRKPVGVMGSRRIFAAPFKLKVLDSYRNDVDCRGNQRATARKYGIHRRQIQKWLQCEENLRSSCTESASNNSVIIVNNGNSNSNSNSNTNTNTIPTTSNIVNSAINVINPPTIGKTAEPTVVSSSSVIIPAPEVVSATAASTLNLRLPRLHGDELAGQQGTPPSHPTLRQGTCPLTCRTSVATNPLPMHALLIGYSDYPGKDLHHQLLHPRPDDTAGMHSYTIDQRGSPNERKYYVLNHPTAYEQSVSCGYRSGSNAGLCYQPQHQPSLSYRSNRRYNGIVSSRYHRILGSSMHVKQPMAKKLVIPLSSASSSSVSSTSSHSHTRDIESPGNEPLATAIKTERASPDSLATPVACNESPSSPAITDTTTCTRLVYPTSQHTYESGIATPATAAQAPHYEHTPRTEGSHVRVSAGSHTLSDSEKGEQQHHTEPMYVKRENDGEIRIKDEFQDVGAPKGHAECDRRLEDKRAIDERDGSNYSANSLPLSTNNSDAVSGSRSPTEESACSRPCSPREVTSNSSRSTASSGSDSDMDLLDCSSVNHNPTSDFPRRRSFSLRFKLDVLDAFHNDAVVAGNQRATARKFDINRRQVQKWLSQETELRGEIALRGGDLRQRLGPLQELPESAVDLRTGSSGRSDGEMDILSPAYCCHSPCQRLLLYPAVPAVGSELAQRTCISSCCADNLTTSSITSGYPESRRSCYPECQESYYCCSTRDSLDRISPDRDETTSSPLKRTGCTLTCDDAPSPPKLTCTEVIELECNKTSNQDQLPQEAPLCLVKDKSTSESPAPLQTERVTSTVPTLPVPTDKRDAILFKPYLDNPVSKPTNDNTQLKHEQSPTNKQRSVIVNNNNCTSISNLCDKRDHDHAVCCTSLHVNEVPDCIALARYPTTPHYI